MSVQYKTEDGWKNISSSSNNAVDTVADGNMNPVTSNAVYDALTPVDITSQITWTTENFTVSSYETSVFKIGRLVIANIRGTLLSNSSYTKIGSGFPELAADSLEMDFPFTIKAGGADKSGNGLVYKTGDIYIESNAGTGVLVASFSYIAVS